MGEKWEIYFNMCYYLGTWFTKWFLTKCDWLAVELIYWLFNWFSWPSQLIKHNDWLLLLLTDEWCLTALSHDKWLICGYALWGVMLNHHWWVTGLRRRSLHNPAVIHLCCTAQMRQGWHDLLSDQYTQSFHAITSSTAPPVHLTVAHFPIPVHTT